MFKIKRLSNVNDRIGCKVITMKSYLLYAFAMATLAKTATTGITMTPDPNELTISTYPIVWFPIGADRDGNLKSGIPLGTFPVSLKGTLPVCVKMTAKTEVMTTIRKFLEIDRNQNSFLIFLLPVRILLSCWKEKI